MLSFWYVWFLWWPVGGMLGDIAGASSKSSDVLLSGDTPLLRPNESQILRGRLTTDVVLPCPPYKGAGALTWWHCGTERRLIGDVDGAGAVKMAWTREGSYAILENATHCLLLRGARRELVDRYECVVVKEGGERVAHSLWFRLDFSFWYDARWNSLFVGSCLASLVFCAASFVLNAVWIGIRKTVLWWIKRAERMSRVRSMVEAMEKYRQRQMESLHETYHRRVTVIRDNYHQQVEQLRGSYANQVGRFRGYRQAQMENVTQHLDNIRDNYNQQLGRIREYGSRRTEQLWENYERQLNRMRMFTLEHRLKLMRQYKVKQRYINKLLESLADAAHPDDIQKRESEIRAALDLPMEQPTVFPHTTISRSSSYFSLPEFVMEDELLAPPKYLQNALLTAADVPSTSRSDEDDGGESSPVIEPRLRHQLFGPPELGGMVVVNHSHLSSGGQHPHNWNTATVRSAVPTPPSLPPPLITNNTGDGFSDAGGVDVVRRASRSLYGGTPAILHERQRGDSDGHYPQDDDPVGCGAKTVFDSVDPLTVYQRSFYKSPKVEDPASSKNILFVRESAPKTTAKVSFVDEFAAPTFAKSSKGAEMGAVRLETFSSQKDDATISGDESAESRVADERLAEQEKLLGKR